MPFEPQNKNEDGDQYPRLRLKKDEKKRIVVLDTAVVAFVHTLRAPKIVNGKPVKESAQQRDGSFRDVFVYDFIGRPICLGDFGILMNDGLDPKNCPACADAKKSDMILKPQRRFACHVAVYNTKPGTFEPSLPFGVQIMSWAFADTTFNKLTDFVTEHGPLLQHDLMLGPCTVESFQKFDINISQRAAWLLKPEFQEHVKVAFANNKAPDLEAFTGRKVQRAYMLEDIQRIHDRWAIANQEQQATDALGPVDTTPLTESLGNLLDETAPAAPAQPLFADPLAALAQPEVQQMQNGQAAAGASVDSQDTPREAAIRALAEAGESIPTTAASAPAPVQSPAEVIDVSALLESAPTETPDPLAVAASAAPVQAPAATPTSGSDDDEFASLLESFK